MKKAHDSSSILNNFGERIRQIRKERGLSQEDFADLCNIDRSYIGGIERGERNISLINLSKISKALQIKLSELFTGVKND